MSEIKVYKQYNTFKASNPCKAYRTFKTFKASNPCKAYKTFKAFKASNLYKVSNALFVLLISYKNGVT